MRKKIFFAMAIICWLMLIFYFSSMEAKESANQSRSLIVKIINLCEDVGIVNPRLTDSQMKQVIRKIHHPVRKLAHMSIYFVLAILINLALDTKREKFWKNMFITLLICFAYSATDELHQTFVVGRSGEFADCIIDTCGATIACLIYGIKACAIHKSD